MLKKYFYYLQILVVSLGSLLCPVDVLASNLKQGDSLPKKIKIQYTQIRVQQNGLELPPNTVVNSKNQNIDVLYDWRIPDGQQIKANDYFMINGIPRSFQAASALGLNVDLLDSKNQVLASAQYKDNENKIKFIFKKNLAANDLKGHLTMNFKVTYNEQGWANFKINQKNYRLFDDRYQQRNIEMERVQPNQTNLNDQYLPIKKSGRYDYDPKTKQLTYTWRIFLNHAKLANNEFIVRDTLPNYLNLDVKNINVNYGYLKLKKGDDQQAYLTDFNRQGVVPPSNINIQPVQGRELVIKGKTMVGNQYDYEISYTTAIDVNNANFKYLRQGNNIEVKNMVQLEDTHKNILGDDVASLTFVATSQGISEYIEQGNLKIIKQDQINQKLLTGAVFNLYDKEKHLVKNNLTTDQNGSVLVPNLKIGQYILKEIKAPNGYKIDQKELTLQIEEGQTKTITVANEPQPANVKVIGTLKWLDKHDLKAYRPQQVELMLLQNGVVLKKLIVTDKNKWNYKIENLPEFDEFGKNYQYTVNLVNIPKYSIKKDGFDFINVLTGITSVQGKNIWQDQNNESRLRPNQIEIELLQNKKVIKKVKIGPEHQWQYKFDQLEQYNDRGREYKYDVVAVPVKNYSTQKEGYDFINVFQPSYMQIHGHKIWIDNDNAEKTRPNQIAVKLFKNGQIINKKAVNSYRQWNYEFNQLEKYDANGNLNHYQIGEDPVDGYITDIKGFNLQNTLKDGQTQVQGTHIWQDNNDYEKIRPNQIILELMQAKKVIETQTITKKNNWQYVFKNLPKYQNGVKLDYQVRERPIKGYQTQYKDSSIFNTIVGITQVKGKISWQDQNDQSKLRPHKIIVKLFQNGIEYRKVQVEGKDNWEYIFNELPKYDQFGKLYKYTVSDIKVPGYDSKHQGNEFINRIKLTLKQANLVTLPATKFETVEKIEDKKPNLEVKAQEQVESSNLNEPASVTAGPQVLEAAKEQEAELATLPATKFETVEKIEDKNSNLEVKAQEQVESSNLNEPAIVTAKPQVLEAAKEQEAALATLPATKFETVEKIEDKKPNLEVRAQEQVESSNLNEPAIVTAKPQVLEAAKEQEAALATLPVTKFETVEKIEDKNSNLEVKAQEQVENSSLNESVTVTAKPQVLEVTKETEAELVTSPVTKFEIVEKIEDKNSNLEVKAQEQVESSNLNEPAIVTAKPQVLEAAKEQEAALATLPATKFEIVEKIEDKNSNLEVKAQEQIESSNLNEPASVTAGPQVLEAAKEQETELATLPATKFETAEKIEDKKPNLEVKAQEQVESSNLNESVTVTVKPQVLEAAKEQETELATLPAIKFETVEKIEDKKQNLEVKAQEQVESSNLNESVTVTAKPQVLEAAKEQDAELATLPAIKFETVEKIEAKKQNLEVKAQEQVESSNLNEPASVTAGSQVLEAAKEQEAELATIPATKFETVEKIEDKKPNLEVKAQEQVESCNLNESVTVTAKPQVLEAAKEQETELATLPATKFETAEKIEAKKPTLEVKAQEQVESSNLNEPASVTAKPQVLEAAREQETELVTLPAIKFETAEKIEAKNSNLEVKAQEQVESSNLNESVTVIEGRKNLIDQKIKATSTKATIGEKTPEKINELNEPIRPFKDNELFKREGKPKLPSTHIYEKTICLIKLLFGFILIILMMLYWFFRNNKMV